MKYSLSLLLVALVGCAQVNPSNYSCVPGGFYSETNGLCVERSTKDIEFYSANTKTGEIDASGNFTTIGTLTTDGATTHTGAVTCSSTLAVTGASTFTGDAAFNGGAGAITATAAGSSLVCLDNSATGFVMGSSGNPNMLQLDTQTGAEKVVVEGTTAVTAFHVDLGNALFDEDVTVNGDVAVTGDLAVTGSITGLGSVTFKGYTIGDIGTAATHYAAGFYLAPAAETALSQASLTQTYGAANNGYGAHAFFVAKGDGATDGTDLVITVTGISMTDAGVRNGADSEVIVGAGAYTTGCTAGAQTANLATNVYCETQKKWLGQITYTLSSTGGTVYNVSGNYGFAKYEDFGNRAFTVTDTECVYRGGANETDLGIRFLLHSTAGWTYSAAAFAPGGTAIASLDTDYSTDDEFDTTEYGAYKRAGLSQAVNGDNGEGIVIEVSTAVNNSIKYMDCHLGVTF